METCLPPRGSHAWLQRHASALYFQAPALNKDEYTDPKPRGMLGMWSRSHFREHEAAEKTTANLRWLRRLSGPPAAAAGKRSFWVAPPPLPSGAPYDDMMEWAMDIDDSCRLGLDSLMLLLSHRFKSKAEMQEHNYRDPEMAAMVCRTERLTSIPRMLLACRRLRVSGRGAAVLSSKPMAGCAGVPL